MRSPGSREFSPAASASTTIAGIDRTVLERYLADLPPKLAGADAAAAHRPLNAFFQAIRQHGWDDELPANATFYTERLSPAAPSGCPARWPSTSWPRSNTRTTSTAGTNPEGRLVTLILMRCGLRIGDACGCALDCIIRDTAAPPTCATSTTR